MADIIKLSNGTYLYPLPGATNTHLDHYHVAEDGTILSVKEGGVQKYGRKGVREKINAVTGMDFPPKYSVQGTEEVKGTGKGASVFQNLPITGCENCPGRLAKSECSSLPYVFAHRERLQKLDLPAAKRAEAQARNEVCRELAQPKATGKGDDLFD